MRLFAVLALLTAVASIDPVLKAAGDELRTVDIVSGDDMKFSVTTITAKPGERIRLRLTVKGTVPKVAMAHNFVLLKPGTNIEKLLAEGAPHRMTDFIAPHMTSSVIAKTALAGAGEVVQTTFTVPVTPGRYPYTCSFSGHFQSGMKGTLIVKSDQPALRRKTPS